MPANISLLSELPCMIYFIIAGLSLMVCAVTVFRFRSVQEDEVILVVPVNPRGDAREHMRVHTSGMVITWASDRVYSLSLRPIGFKLHLEHVYTESRQPLDVLLQLEVAVGRSRQQIDKAAYRFFDRLPSNIKMEIGSIAENAVRSTMAKYDREEIIQDPKCIRIAIQSCIAGTLANSGLELRAFAVRRLRYGQTKHHKPEDTSDILAEGSTEEPEAVTIEAASEHDATEQNDLS